MSPEIKLVTHEQDGCGGIAVHVPSGSVYGGTVLFCLKCMEDTEEKLKTENRRMRVMLGAIKAWCSRNGHTYAEKLAMHGLGESVSPPEPPAAPVG